jgi:hypothetical protein
MRSTHYRALPVSLVAGLFALFAGSSSVAAQSQLDASQAQAFMGAWVMVLETDFGAMNLELEIEDMSGKVGAQVGSADFGGFQSITDITRSGENLLMKYMMDAQGQMIDIAMTLERQGEGLGVRLDVAGGQMTLNTTATKGS